MPKNLLTIQFKGVHSNNTSNIPAADIYEYLNGPMLNTGDMVVSDAILQLLEFDKRENIEFDPLNPELSNSYDFEHLNSNFDLAVLRGANYIRDDYELETLGTILQKLKIPVVAMGIGAQAPTYKKIKLSETTIRTLKLLSEKSHSIGVRGHYTAEVLNDLGIKNSHVIGCPSLFRHKLDSFDIEKPVINDFSKVGLNLNINLKNNYGDNWIKFIRQQGQLLNHCFSNYNAQLFTQGEINESMLAAKTEEYQKSAIQGYIKRGLPEILKIVEKVQSNIVFPLSVQEWEDAAKQIDLMIGVRFHGNTIALSNGIPTIYLTNDTRSHELATFIKAPIFDLRTSTNLDVEHVVNAADFSKFNENYSFLVSNFNQFVTNNNLPIGSFGSVKTNSTPIKEINLIEPKSELDSFLENEYKSISSSFLAHEEELKALNYLVRKLTEDKVNLLAKLRKYEGTINSKIKRRIARFFN